MQNEQELTKLAKSDSDALGKLYDHYYDKVFGFFMRQCNRNVAIAQDLTSETFMKMVASIGSFEYRHENSFSAWLFTIASNILNSFWRKNSRYVYSPPEELDYLLEAGENSEEMSEIEAEYNNNEQFLRVQEILSNLDEKYRLVIELRFMQEMSYAEISEITKININTLKAQLHRALEQIKKQINNNINFSED